VFGFDLMKEFGNGLFKFILLENPTFPELETDD